MSKPRLELTWIGKENRPRLEPRILLEDPSKSYHAKYRVKESPQEDTRNAKNLDSSRRSRSFAANTPSEVGDLFDNRLIFGDNLLALKALEQEFTGKIKCIYIDPPYNTGAAFAEYDDGIEHSLWLTLIRDRLEILKRLLANDGSLWVSLDDTEAHYFKVLGDELFGRENFIIDVAWQKRDGPPNDRAIGAVHEHVLVWGKTKSGSSRKTLAEEAFNLMPRTEKADAQYQVWAEPTGPEPRGPFRKIDTTGNAKGGRFVQSLVYPITNPFTGEEVWPRKGTCWRHSKDEMARLQSEGRLFWGVKGTATTPMRKLFKSEAKQGMAAPSIWSEVALNQHASAEMEQLFGEKAAFETPKPEALLRRIVHIASNPGDWVLDSFAGSGTTGAVAHKMGRKWIMVELGEHCHTHIIPRLKKVIDGEDAGGITEAVGWKGGGGFRYYSLAPSLLEKDRFGQWIISKKYNPTMLAEALCKLEGFAYAPSETVYWQQGHSTETDFIYVTTQTLSSDQLSAISEDVGEKNSLLILCYAFRARDLSAFPNLTVKKIPKAVLDRCEWGHDDYSLEIKNLPKAEARAEPRPLNDGAGKKRRGRAPEGQGSLFD